VGRKTLFKDEDSLEKETSSRKMGTGKDELEDISSEDEFQTESKTERKKSR